MIGIMQRVWQPLPPSSRTMLAVYQMEMLCLIEALYTLFRFTGISARRNGLSSQKQISTRELKHSNCHFEWQCTSRHETDSATHLDKRSKEHTCVQTYGSAWTNPKRFTVVFENSTATSFVYTTMVYGQPAGLSREAFEGGRWLAKLICQSEGGERSILKSETIPQTLQQKGP